MNSRTVAVLVWAVLLSSSLLVTAIPAAAAAGTTSAADGSTHQQSQTPAGPAPSVATQTTTTDASEIQIAPANVSLAPGGAYTLAVTIPDRGAVDDVTLDITVSGAGAGIKNATTFQSEGGFTPADRTDSTTASQRVGYAADSLLIDDTVLLTVEIPETATASDTVVVEAQYAADPGLGSNIDTAATATYPVADTATTYASLAARADARAALSEQYADSYNRIREGSTDGFETVFARGMIAAVTSVGVESAKDRAVGPFSTVGAALDAKAAYDTTINQDGLVSEVLTTLAPIIDSFGDFDAYYNERVFTADETNTSLVQLAAQQRAEAEAWRNHDREAALSAIDKQEKALCVDNRANTREYPTQIDRASVPCVEQAAKNQHAAAYSAPDGSDARQLTSYFSSISTYAREEQTYINQRLRPLATSPSPSVTTERPHSDVESELEGLSVGDQAVVEVTVSNDGAGVSDRGYLSVSHATTLSIVDIAQLNTTNETFTRVDTEPGAEVRTSAGNGTAESPLVDIIDSYGPGESNTYAVTVERVAPGDAWLTYRSALKPAVATGDTAAYARAPTDVGTTDQQGWAAYRLEVNQNGTSGGDNESRDDKQEPHEATSQWRMWGGDAANTGYVGLSDGPTQSVGIDWNVTLGSAVTAPAVVDGTAYVGTDAGQVYAIDTTTGEETWAATVEGSATAPAVVDGTAYVGTDAGQVYAIDTTTGEINWATAIEGSVTAPAVVDGTAYVGTDAGRVYAIDTTAGEITWSLETAEIGPWDEALPVTHTPAVSDGSVYFTYTDSHHVFAVNASTGATEWSWEGDNVGDMNIMPLTATADAVYMYDTHGVFASDTYSTVVSLNATTGNVAWENKTSDPPLQVAAGNDTVYATTSVWNNKANAFAFSHAGQQEWTWKTGAHRYFDEQFAGHPAVTDETIYLTAQNVQQSCADQPTVSDPCDEDGRQFPVGTNLHALSTATGTSQWALELPGTPSSPAVTAESVYVGSGSSLYAISETDGDDGNENDDDGTPDNGTDTGSDAPADGKNGTTVDDSAGAVVTDGFEDGDLSAYRDVETATTATDTAYAGDNALVITDRNDDIDTDAQGMIGNTVTRSFAPTAPSNLSVALRSDAGIYNTVGVQWKNESGSVVHGTRIQNYHDDLYYGGQSGATLATATPRTWYHVELTDIDWEENTVGEIRVNDEPVATNEPFVNPGGSISELRFVVHDGGTGSQGFFDEVTVGDAAPAAQNESALSFEDSPAGQPPQDPWTLEETAGEQRVSNDRATAGSQSLYLAGASGLGQSWATVDVNLTDVATVRGDIYVESGDTSAGDIKVHIDNVDQGIMGATQKAEDEWHTDLEGDVTGYDGTHTVILRTRGANNRAYFDNFRFYDSDGHLLAPSAVVSAGDDSTQPASDRLDVPFTEGFADGINGWTVSQRFRTSDEFVSEWGTPAPGDGGYSDQYNGSVRLHVDGGPSTVGVARNVSGIPAGTNLSVRYETSPGVSQPGKVAIALYEPDSDDAHDTLVATTPGDVTAGPQTISGTVSETYPPGTELRVLADVWPGEYTVHVTNIAATQSPTRPDDSLNLSVSPTPIPANTTSEVTITATDVSGSRVSNVTIDLPAFGVSTTTSDGTATPSVTPDHPGSYDVSASAEGYATATATLTVEAASTGEHESGVSEALFDAVDKNGDDVLSRDETRRVVKDFIRAGETDGVSISRDDVRSLVKYFIQQSIK